MSTPITTPLDLARAARRPAHVTGTGSRLAVTSTLLRDLFRPNPFKRICFYLASDTLAIYLATLLSAELAQPPAQPVTMLGFLAIATALQLGTSALLGGYSLKWSTFSLADLPRLSIGSLAAGVLLTILTALRLTPLPFAGVVLWTLTNLAVAVLVRSSKRLANELLMRRGRRSLLVVCSEKGYFLVDLLRRIPRKGYRIVGFIDPEPRNRGVLSQGLPVLGTTEEIEEVIRRHRIETVFIFLSASDAGTTVPLFSINRLYERLYRLRSVEVRTIPSFRDLIQDRADIGALERLSIHELTGRPPVTVDPQEMAQVFGGKRILITGAGGSIGSELSRQLAQFQPSLIVLFERDDSNLFEIERELRAAHPGLNLVPWLGDITRESQVERAFRAIRPQIVFHAAAYKHVPILEFYPEDAIRVNVQGAHIVARNAVRHPAECFVYISTDKAVNPTSVMGASKRLGEMLITSMNGLGDVRFLAVRFGNVLDSRGSVSGIFRSAIARRQPIPVTHPEMKRYFMLPSEAVLLVMQAAALGRGGEVFVLDMGNPIRITDLARTMIRQAGLRPDVDIPLVFTGLRPGEKLSEELLTAEEGSIATANDRIYRARISRNYCYPDILEQVAPVFEAVRRSSSDLNQRALIRALVQRLIPSYRPDTRIAGVHPSACNPYPLETMAEHHRSPDPTLPARLKGRDFSAQSCISSHDHFPIRPADQHQSSTRPQCPGEIRGQTRNAPAQSRNSEVNLVPTGLQGRSPCPPGKRREHHVPTTSQAVPYLSSTCLGSSSLGRIQSHESPH